MKKTKFSISEFKKEQGIDKYEKLARQQELERKLHQKWLGSSYDRPDSK